MMKIPRWNPTSLGSSRSSWRMPMRKDLIRTVSNPVILNSKAKTKERRMLRMAVSTLFPLDQSASNVKVLDTWNKNVQHISKQLRKARLLLLPWVTPSLRLSQMIVMTIESGNLECLYYYSGSYWGGHRSNKWRRGIGGIKIWENGWLRWHPYSLWEIIQSF